MSACAFYARPHPRWQTNADGSPRTVNGFLQPVLNRYDEVEVSNYTLAIGSGPQETRLSSGRKLPWPKFKTKRAAMAFIEGRAP